MPTDRTKLAPAADAARLPPPPSFRRAPHRLAAGPPVMLEDVPTARQLDLARALRRLHLLLTRGETMTSQISALMQNTSWPDGSPGDVAYRRNLCHVGHLAAAGLDADREALAALCAILDDLEPAEPPRAA